jgi:hypothetical protein
MRKSESFSSLFLRCKDMRVLLPHCYKVRPLVLWPLHVLLGQVFRILDGPSMADPTFLTLDCRNLRWIAPIHQEVVELGTSKL